MKAKILYGFCMKKAVLRTASSISPLRNNLKPVAPLVQNQIVESDHHDQPPAGLSHKLEHDIDVIERNDGGPTRLTGLFIDLPIGSKDENHECKPDKCEKEHRFRI
jgi:hypothetical protein